MQFDLTPYPSNTILISVLCLCSANQAIKDCVSGTFGGILQVLVGQVK